MIVKKYIKKIEFKEKLFDCIVCLNSNLPSIRFFNKFKNIKILAADGAAIKLYKKGIIADFVIGDLDSFKQSKVFESYTNDKVIYDESQETNDFQKVLDFAIKQDFHNILVVGFHGGELEHTLNNCSILFKYKNLLNLCVYDKSRYAIPVDESVELKCKTGETISLIPLTKTIIQTQNLKWELNNEILELGVREGARNIATKDIIFLNIKKGSLLLFFDARLPFAPKK
ncbi:MAG TPA: thiamine diphosphokinase [Candidatus Kapabacteria bacterium]|nr:thiamine diphosphokinase [Candidatus Kapabacteria bacterium]